MAHFQKREDSGLIVERIGFEKVQDVANIRSSLDCRLIRSQNTRLICDVCRRRMAGSFCVSCN